ncbi:MAG: phosphatidylserine decarboxylase [Halobacteria archaeon]
MLAKGGVKWILYSFFPAIVARLISRQYWWTLLSLPFAAALFYRDPDRDTPESGVVSPADGRVSVIEEEDSRVRIGVFMNVTDVHVNRSPVTGVVESNRHVPGGHLPAFTKSSERNERQVTEISAEEGDFRVVQIAGTVARRITSYLNDGEGIDRGDRIGLIAFGSRADVLLPERYGMDDVDVDFGEKVYGGETVIAKD